MPIRPEFLVRDANGRPQPPAELVAKLKQFDPRIGLFYTNVAWAITEAWREDDPRRERIQQGDIQPEMCFDICGYLPVTCALDEALPYIERELRTHTTESFAALRYAAAHWNDEVQPAAVEQQVMTAVDAERTESIGVVAVPAVAPLSRFEQKQQAKKDARAAKLA